MLPGAEKGSGGVASSGGFKGNFGRRKVPKKIIL